MIHRSRALLYWLRLAESLHVALYMIAQCSYSVHICIISLFLTIDWPKLVCTLSAENNTGAEVTFCFRPKPKRKQKLATIFGCKRNQNQARKSIFSVILHHHLFLPLTTLITSR